VYNTSVGSECLSCSYRWNCVGHQGKKRPKLARFSPLLNRDGVGYLGAGAVRSRLTPARLNPRAVTTGRVRRQGAGKIPQYWRQDIRQALFGIEEAAIGSAFKVIDGVLHYRFGDRLGWHPLSGEVASAVNAVLSLDETERELAVFLLRAAGIIPAVD
jgi:hypothetical protein